MRCVSRPGSTPPSRPACRRRARARSRAVPRGRRRRGRSRPRRGAGRRSPGGGVRITVAPCPAQMPSASARSGSSAAPVRLSARAPGPSAIIADVAPSRVSTPSAGIPRPPSAAARPRARRPRRAAAEGDRRLRLRSSEVVDPRPARAIAVSSSAGRRRSAASSAASPVTSAHTESTATTAPQNACVCVTARWFGTETSARAPARAPSVDSAFAVTAANGAGAPGVDRLDEVAELARRGEDEQGVAGPPRERPAREQAARHGDDLRAAARPRAMRARGRPRRSTPRRSRLRRCAGCRRPEQRRHIPLVRARRRASPARVDGSSVTSRQSPVSSSTSGSLTLARQGDEGRADDAALGPQPGRDDRERRRPGVCEPSPAGTLDAHLERRRGAEPAPEDDHVAGGARSRERRARRRAPPPRRRRAGRAQGPRARPPRARARRPAQARYRSRPPRRAARRA